MTFLFSKVIRLVLRVAINLSPNLQVFSQSNDLHQDEFADCVNAVHLNYQDVSDSLEDPWFGRRFKNSSAAARASLSSPHDVAGHLHGENVGKRYHHSYEYGW